MRLTDQLLLVAASYADFRGLSVSRVSTLCLGQGNKLQLISDGADITTATFEKAMKWFDENWPDGAVWPVEVPRPPAAHREVEASLSVA